MIVLLVEDDDDKALAISQFLREQFLNVEIVRARSSMSGLRALIGGANSINIVILDMSMPNFDVSPNEPLGGGPEHFAGRELLAQMKLRRINLPAVVVTMFDAFGEPPNRVSLSELASELEVRYSPIFRGIVYYNTVQEGWRASLSKLIRAEGQL